MPKVTFKEKDGGCRPLLSVRNIIVLPGTHEMSAEDWTHVKGDKGCHGYIARGELTASDADESWTDTEPPSAPDNDGPSGHTAEELAEFVQTISKMTVEDASALIIGCDTKEALIALAAKDNREAIKDLCEDRLRVL